MTHCHSRAVGVAAGARDPSPDASCQTLSAPVSSVCSAHLSPSALTEADRRPLALRRPIGGRGSWSTAGLAGVHAPGAETPPVPRSGWAHPASSVSAAAPPRAVHSPCASY
eukprot:4001021-Prymnesium_polylepis.2